MKKMKSLLLLMATILLFAVAFCMNASAAEWKALGDSHQFAFDEDTKVMVIKGEGEISSELFGIACPNHYARYDDSCNCEYINFNGMDMDDYIDSMYPERLEAYRASRKTETLIIQEGTTSLSTSAFYNFSELKVAILPQSITEIPAGAFFELDELYTVTLPNCTTSIGENAFYKCSNLKNIYIPNTVERVEKNAFFGCEEDAIRIPDSAMVIIPPEKPSKITATPDTFAVTLSWNKCLNADGYRVYYWETNRPSIQIAVSSTKATTCTVKSLGHGTKYTFAVRPYNMVDGEVIWTDYTTINTATKAIAPTVTATRSTSAIKLNYSTPSGATGFRIYENVGGKWVIKVNSTTSANYTFNGLEPGTKHTYAVRPYLKIDSGVVWSDYTTITTATKPATVTAKVSSPSKGKITLTWNAVNGADGYQVYYKTGNGSYKLYKTYGTAQTLTFSNLKSGTGYTFAVRAGIRTSNGNIYGSYTPVSVTVK